MVFAAKRVAVIGAGVSGLTSARHLKSTGLEVVIYERSSVSGGIWCRELDICYRLVTDRLKGITLNENHLNRSTRLSSHRWLIL